MEVKSINGFPFSEKILAKYKNPGLLLEYAIYDTTRIDFVKNIICDTLDADRDIVFEKCVGIIKDSVYNYYGLQERMYVNAGYIGTLYFDAESLDTFSMYSAEYQYTTDNFHQAIKEIFEHISVRKKN